MPLDKSRLLSAPHRKGGGVVRAIGSSPDEPYSLIYATLISAIRSAEKEVLLTNAYFVPDPQLLDVLKQAAARGVDVRLLLPSKTDSDLVFRPAAATTPRCWRPVSGSTNGKRPCCMRRRR